MTSIYERALGADFSRLHPQIQRRFSLSADNATASIGTGVMHHVWHGAPHTMPFLMLGAWRNIMFPEAGKDVPFTISNYAYRDSFGRDTVTWIRNFDFAKSRRFDAYMIYSESRGKIVDYLGNHQHLAVDIDVHVGGDGSMCLRSSQQRFYEGWCGFTFPHHLTGIANVREWYDDGKECFRIEVAVENHVFGPLFGYEGSFNVEWLENAVVPAELRPIREERRE